MEIPLTYHGYLMKNPHGNHQHQHAPRRPMAVANQRISALPWPLFFWPSCDYVMRIQYVYLYSFCSVNTTICLHIYVYIFTFIVIVVMIYAYIYIYIHTLFIYFIMLTICISVYIYIYSDRPRAVTVTTTGQHKRSTTKMLQIGFISNKKSQHIATFKSGEIRSFGDDSPY